MNKVSFLAILLILLSVGFSNAQSGKDKKVAVFDPVGDVSNNLKIIIREELSNAVVNTLGFTVLERELINKVLAESEFQMTGHVDDGQIGELGKKMGANYVAYASISSVGGNYYISCKMVDVMTAKIERQNTGITQSGLDDLFSVVSAVSRAMLQQQSTSVKTSTSSSKPTVYKQVYEVNESDKNDLTEINMMGLSLLVMPIDAAPDKVTWHEANAMCLESSAYGLDEWRLPTKLEISEMYAQNDKLKKMEKYWYWSATPEKSEVYFRQAFDADKLAPAKADAKAFARCVHNNGTINLANNDGVWEYSLYGTNYMVMPEDLPGEHRWEEAMNVCENSTAHGYNDWYLPTIDDLEFLYKNKVALNMIGEWYWSSTEKGRSAKYEINFVDGKRYDTSANAKRQVRCIRKNR